MRNRLAWVGTVFTAVYLFGFTYFIFDRLPQLKSMDLNNVGDFLAGAFGPIAFFWLILGFMQQGAELRFSADALRLQAEELKRSVEQQCKMVAAQKIGLINYERSLQPLLHVSVADAGWFEGEFYIDIEVKNTGEYCESLVAKLIVGDGEVGTNHLDPIIRGGVSYIRFTNLDERPDFHVEIKYRIMSGSLGVQKFTATHYMDDDSDKYFVQKHSFLGDC
jgi:hypothetical protein